MTYTPDDITDYIAQRVAAVGEDSKDVRIIKQQSAEIKRMRMALEEIRFEYDPSEDGRNARTMYEIADYALPTQEKAHD